MSYGKGGSEGGGEGEAVLGMGGGGLSAREEVKIGSGRNFGFQFVPDGSGGHSLLRVADAKPGGRGSICGSAPPQGRRSVCASG